MKKILIKGAGIAGLTSGFMLQQQGYDITILAPKDSPRASASWYAGGMLAPFCEKEHAPQMVEDRGQEAILWWQKYFPQLLHKRGTLVIAPKRDEIELEQFAKKTKNHQWLSQQQIRELEPDIAPAFQKALFFSQEAHIDPRLGLLSIKSALKSQGAHFIELENFIERENENKEIGSLEAAKLAPALAKSASLARGAENYDYIIDASGSARLKQDKQLRGVRGEMLLIKSQDVQFSRPIRFLHPRIPLYIVPRGDNVFMVGATMIESEEQRQITVRSLMEMLNAAYSINSAFSEAEILESASALRPAYLENLPKITRQGKYFYLNGFYRHGFLLAPYMAQQLCEQISAQ